MPVKLVKEGDLEREVCVFSYSSYSMFKKCPSQYYRWKVKKEVKGEDDISFTIPGRIVHDAAARFYSDGSMDFFDSGHLRAELEKCSHYKNVDLEKAYGSFDKALDLVNKSVDSLKTFILCQDPSKKYLSEKWFGVWNSPLKISETLYVQGAADLIEVNDNGTAILYDFKTSWNTRNISVDQLILYSVAAQLKWGINVTMASFFLLPVNRQNFYSFTQEDKDSLIRDMQAAADRVLSEKDRLPAVQNDKCKYCPFVDDCPASGRSVVPVTEGMVSFNDFGAVL